MTVLDERADIRVKSLALEITGQCQNSCGMHCYARSGPHGTHGTMSRDDWFALLDQAAALGVSMVQYIGGEPTLHPYLPQLIDRALSRGMRVEVFSNLVHVRPSMWKTFARPGVSLATSYYSDNAAEHEEITGGRGSYARTNFNITEAIRLGIPLRASIVHVLDGQRIDAACAELRQIGVTGEIRIDRVRAIGNGDATGKTVHDPAELCGRCGKDRAAVSPDGIVTPCVMSRWMGAGSLRHQTLAEILTGPQWIEHVAAVPAVGGPCDPDCNPALDGGDCSPAEQEACGPAFDSLLAVADCNPNADGSDCSPAETEACDPAY